MADPTLSCERSFSFWELFPLDSFLEDGGLELLFVLDPFATFDAWEEADEEVKEDESLFWLGFDCDVDFENAFFAGAGEAAAAGFFEKKLNSVPCFFVISNQDYFFSTMDIECSSIFIYLLSFWQSNK